MILDKLKLPLIIIGLILILVIVMQIRSCVNENRIAVSSELEGRLQALTEEAEKEKEESQKAIQEMQKEIDNLTIGIQDKNQTIVDLQKETEEIEPTPIIEEPEPGEDWETIAKQNAKAAREWKDKYYKAEKLIKELGVPIPDGTYPITGEPRFRYPHGSVTHGLYTQYLLAAGQRDLYKKQLKTKDNLLAIGKKVVKDKDKEIARLKVGKTIERIITWPLAGYGAFKLVQGVFIK